MANIKFVETKRDHWTTEDGRFGMTKEQDRGHRRFTVHDNRRDRRVGSPTSFVSAVRLVRRYLLDEKQREENPTTMPKAKIGDNVVPIRTEAESQTESHEGGNATNAQTLMAHLASIADEDGTFTVYRNRLALDTHLTSSQVQYWMKKFVALEWLVELQAEQLGKPGSYGFSSSREEVQQLVQSMPTRILSKPGKKAEAAPAASQTTGAGILAGKAMVRIQSLESKVDSLIKQVDEMVKASEQLQAKIAEQLSSQKPDLSEFESVLDYLEDSQKKIATFMHDTFGADIS